MQIQDLVNYLNAYVKTENQIENYRIEVNGETNSGINIINSTGDMVDQVDLTDPQI